MSGRMMMEGGKPPMMAKAKDMPEDDGMDDEKTEYKVTFQPPPSYTLPEGAQPGDVFDFTGKARVEQDGKICLVAMDGVPLDENDSPEETDTEQDDTTAAPPTMDQAVAAHKAGNFQM